jgi:tetratricopeptide (TPR) repeat protein
VGLQTPFVGEGRRAIVRDLVAAFDSIETGSSFWFHLEAPTGAGKTRIVQEFYRHIASTRQTQPAYWPNTIVDEQPAAASVFDTASFERTRKEVNPRSFVKPEGAVPNWLWWGFTCGDRHGIRLSSLATDVGQLQQHGPHLVDALSRSFRMSRSIRSKGSQIGEALSSEAAGVALGAAGLTIPGVGLLALLGKYAYTGTRSIKNRQARTHELRLEVVEDHSAVIDDAIEVMELLGRASVPTILIVEDLHWADDALIQLIDRVLSSSDAAALVVTTSWPGHADENSAASQLFEGHHGSLDRFFFGADDGDAFEPLALSDRVQLVKAVLPKVSNSTARRVALRVANPLAIQLVGSLRSLRVRLEDEDRAGSAIDELSSEVSDLYRQAWDELDAGVQLGLGFASLAMPSAMQPRAGLRDHRWNKQHIADRVLDGMVDLIRELTGNERLDSDEAVDYGWSEELDRRLRQFADPAQAELARAFAHKQLSPAERAGFQKRVAAEAFRLGVPADAASAQDEHSIRLHLAAVTAGIIDASPQTFEAGSRLLWKLFRSLGEQPEVEDLAWLLAGIAKDEGGQSADLAALSQLVLLQCAYSRGESEAVEQRIAAIQELASNSDPRIRIALGRLSGRVARSLGDLSKAIEVFTFWSEEAQSHLDINDPDCQALRNDLAFTLGRHGRPSAAVEILRTLLPQDTAPDALTTDPHIRLRREHDYASLLRRQGRPSDATVILFGVLDRQRALLGNNHPDTLATLQLIGAAQRDSGQLSAARRTFQDLLLARTECVGPAHHDTLVARGHLIWVARRSRQWMSALTLASHLLEERIRLFGQRHATVSDASRVMATVLMETGQYEPAERVLLSVLEPSLQDAARDPASVDTLIYLARLRRYQGRLGESAECLRLAAEAGTDFESGHLSLQAAELERLRIDALTGQPERAYEGASRLHDLQQGVLQQKHPELARTEVLLAALCITNASDDEVGRWTARARWTASATDTDHEIWWLIEDPVRMLRHFPGS